MSLSTTCMGMAMSFGALLLAPDPDILPEEIAQPLLGADSSLGSRAS